MALTEENGMLLEDNGACVQDRLGRMRLCSSVAAAGLSFSEFFVSKVPELESAAGSTVTGNIANFLREFIETAETLELLPFFEVRDACDDTVREGEEHSDAESRVS
jgi:hypothetical protein